MTKEQAIKKIEETHQRYLNKDQKNLARTIINALNAKDDIQGYLDFIMKRTGLGFRFDVAPDIAEGRIAVVNEMKDKGINVSDIVDEDENKLIIGDNFEALKNLLLTHESKIDVIYIDPPYNTEKSKEDGNSSSKEGTASNFIYKDKFGRNGWLNMMRDRLTLAKRLLSDEGIIFVSIDDTEQAYLKVLMDEIFLEKNFISNIPRATNLGGKNTEKFLKLNHDYCLIYAKNKSLTNNFLAKKHEGLNYKFIDEKYGKYSLKEIDAPKGLGYVSSMDFDYSFKGKTYSPINGKGERNRWKWSKERFDNAKKLNILVSKNERLYYKMFLEYSFDGKKIIKEDRTISWSSLNYTSSSYLNAKGTKDLKDIIVLNDFTYPKPVLLIKDLILLFPNKNAVILDFFAGSGTTGHAVMELNKEDDGNRKFILVTNNENNIGINTTHERLYRIIKGQTSGDGKKDFPWLKNNSPYKEAKLRVFNIKHYNVETSNISKLEEIKKEAIQNLKKISLKYKPSNINVYYDLDGLNPYNEAQLKQIYSTDPIKEENESN